MHFDVYLREARRPNGAFNRQQTAETGLTQWHNNDHYCHEKQTNLLITTCCCSATSSRQAALMDESPKPATARCPALRVEHNREAAEWKKKKKKKTYKKAPFNKRTPSG